MEAAKAADGAAARLWQADEGCNLDEWSEDEDIAWGALLGAPVYSSSSEDDEDKDEAAKVVEEPRDATTTTADEKALGLKDGIESPPAEDDAAEFVVTEYLISGLKINIKQQPRLGIAHQVWHAVRSSSSSSRSSSPIIYIIFLIK
jgi:hypothetical protein